MHELPATRGILEAALETAARAGARRIENIHVVVGDLTNIVDDSVQFYFDMLSRGTAAAGAALRFRREPASGRCGACGHAFEVRAPLPRSCPSCESLALAVTGGREFYVESIEVSDAGTGGDGDPEGQRPGGAGEP
jgi:hydrogenase nickel incorporation protein HypA/HybF